MIPENAFSKGYSILERYFYNLALLVDINTVRESRCLSHFVCLTHKEKKNLGFYVSEYLFDLIWLEIWYDFRRFYCNNDRCTAST